MAGRHIWIINGVFKDCRTAEADSAAETWRLMNERGAVRLTTGPHGTEIMWVVTSPHVLSLFSAEALVDTLDGPFMLRFYAGGWFEELFSEAGEVHRRIAELVMHGDRHLASRIFVMSPEPDPLRLPQLLQEALQDGAAPSDMAVECRYEPAADAFVVCHVGAKSAIGRIWGTDVSSYPCLATGPLGQNANQSYRRALAEGTPIYEQVIASLRFPDQEMRWVPYHRVIVPLGRLGAGQNVAVVSACAEVDFRVL